MKSVLIISTCVKNLPLDEILKQKSHYSDYLYLFHFKGYYHGHCISAIWVYSDRRLVTTTEYVMKLNIIKVEDGILHGENIEERVIFNYF